MRSKLVLGTLAIAATLMGSGTARAQECKTREQVKAELAEAFRTDTILSGDGTLWKDHLGAPHYSAGAAPTGKTQEQVNAELAETIPGIRAEVLKRIDENPALKTENIDVQSFDHDVYLYGVVSGRIDGEAAEAIAGTVPGVKKVYNATASPGN